jgi:glyoxylase I family protein
MTANRRSLLLGALTLATVGTSGVAASDSREPNMKGTKERVLGIGGLFFRSHDSKALAKWYELHLGINPTPTDYNQPVWQQAAGPTVFSPFPTDTKYFGSPQQAWMVNFRVRDLDAMTAQLRASNIAVEVDPKTYPNGRFARLHDPDGNPIELWEPAGAKA